METENRARLKRKSRNSTQRKRKNERSVIGREKLDLIRASLDKASIERVLTVLQEASTHPSRTWVVADYVAPRGVVLAQTIDLIGMSPSPHP